MNIDFVVVGILQWTGVFGYQCRIQQWSNRGFDTASVLRKKPESDKAVCPMWWSSWHSSCHENSRNSCMGPTMDEILPVSVTAKHLGLVLQCPYKVQTSWIFTHEIEWEDRFSNNLSIFQIVSNQTTICHMGSSLLLALSSKSVGCVYVVLRWFQ